LRVMNVSTGRAGRETPSGVFKVGAVMRRCGAIDGSTLDNCVFFIGETYALHATPAANYSLLGRQASAGCVRQTLPDSAWLLGLVNHVGKQNVTVRIRAASQSPDAQLLPLIRYELDSHTRFVESLIGSR